MKVTEIVWSRTYSQNYQTYRAEASAKLEDCETDLDACYDELKEIVREQIGKQCSDYKGLESDEIVSLREMIEKLRHERAKMRKDCRAIKNAIQENLGKLDNVTDLLENQGLELLRQLIAVLKANGFDLDSRLQDLEELAVVIERFPRFARDFKYELATEIIGEDESLIPM